MKRKLFYFISVVLLLTVAISGCKKEPVTGVNLDKLDLYVGVGKTATLTASIVPPNAHNQNVSWESSDPDVATVDNGIVAGKTLGKATITVTTEDGKYTAKCYVVVVQPIEPIMVQVDGGTFMMGCQDDECSDNELPTHEVTLTGFNMAKYPVTQKEWVAIMNNNPSAHKEDNLPVERVSYDDAQNYIQRLNELTGKNYRLPTEAEWEYAARGGNKSKGYKYSGSDNADEVAWIGGITQQVGTKAPNELGIYDMSGNVWEYCSDWYEAYTDAPQTDPQGPNKGSRRVIRGGSFNYDTTACRVAHRRIPTSNTAAANVGFRLVHP